MATEKVLIVVKSWPTLSKKYYELVCTTENKYPIKKNKKNLKKLLRLQKTFYILKVLPIARPSCNNLGEAEAPGLNTRRFFFLYSQFQILIQLQQINSFMKGRVIYIKDEMGER
jgi:hypothetical protein